MEKIKLIIKGIVFYFTIIYFIFMCSSIDSLTEIYGYKSTLNMFLVFIFSIIICFACLNKKDIEKLTFSKWLKDKFNL